MIPAVKFPTSLLAVAVLLAGCGGQGSHAGPSPSARSSGSPGAPATPQASASPASSPAVSPAPLTGTFAVLATAPSADAYTVSIVSSDGKIVGSAQPSSPTAVTCGDAAAAVLPPPISTSDDRAYYMDAQGVVRFLTTQGETGRATTVPTGGGRRSMFSVSPDDQRIAVIVNDYTASGVSIKLYVEDLNGGTNRTDTYTQSGAYGLWPVGWHGSSNLILAKVPACATGGGPFASTPQEFHVVDSGTFVRRFTVGGPTCVIAGSPSPAGAVCESTASLGATVLNWTGSAVRTFPIGSPPPRAYLSPSGSHVALVTSNGTLIEDTRKDFAALATCAWIDDTHVLAGGDVQHQPRIANVTTGVIVPVSAQGMCAGRLPGGL